MEETLVSFLVAKLAKEKGFDWKCSNYYSGLNLYSDTAEDYNNKTIGDTPMHIRNAGYYSLPTQSLLQKWLRDKHNIHIEIQSPDNTEEGWKISSIRKISNPFSVWDTEESFDNYEKALEMGLQEALKLI